MEPFAEIAPEGLKGRVEAGDAPELSCHHGIRSSAVVQWLRRVGIPAANLEGGIDAWALRVDPTLGRY